MKLIELFEEVADFRRESQVLYPLNELLVIALCAVLGGANDFEEIVEYGKEKSDFLKGFLVLENGIASRDTFERVFQNISSSAFESCLVKHSKEVLAALSKQQINIDGKVLKATGTKGKKTAAICIVSAWASEQNLCLGQAKVDKKSNEKTAIPELLKTLDIEGALVSIDAMGCDKNIAKRIRAKEGDYLLALKKNQKNLYEEVHDWMQSRKENLDCFEQTDYVAGRIEKRSTYVCTDLTFIDEAVKWKDSQSIIMVEAQRSFKQQPDKISFKRRFYISSAHENAVYFGAATRKHWSIENELHWFLDVVFREDNQRLRTGNAVENMAILRKVALQTLLKHKGKKSMKTFRKKIGWNDDLLWEIISNFS